MRTVYTADDDRVHTRVAQAAQATRTDGSGEPWYTGVTRQPAAVKRTSWAAVLAGVTIALVVQLVLSLLGIGIGASSVDPLVEESPTAGLATGAGLWFLGSLLIALLAGGWVAGRLQGMPRGTDGLLHGLLTWSVATLLVFYFLTSTVGNLIGGTFRVLGAGLSTAASSLASAAPAIGNAAGEELRQRGIDVSASAIRREIETLLRQTGTPELQPDAIERQADQAAAQTQDAARRAATDPATSDSTVAALLERLGRSGETLANAADRDALINVVMARTGQSRAQAEQTVASYERTYQDMRARYEQARMEADQRTREAADRAAGGVSRAAFSAFVALVVSALAGAIGGWLGTPRGRKVALTTAVAP